MLSRSLKFYGLYSGFDQIIFFNTLNTLLDIWALKHFRPIEENCHLQYITYNI